MVLAGKETQPALDRFYQQLADTALTKIVVMRVVTAVSVQAEILISTAVAAVATLLDTITNKAEKLARAAAHSLAEEVPDDTAETHLTILEHQAAAHLVELEITMAEPALLVYV